MKRINHLQGMLVPAVCLLIITSCQKQVQKDVLANKETLSATEKIVMPNFSNSITSSVARATAQDYNTFYGPAVQMGNGHARSWINISRADNKPLAIGIELTAKSMDGLPQDPMDMAASTFVLPLHQKAAAVTPFDHITINWNPHGHEPEHIYDVPHFDLHFYKISLDQQMSITGVPGAAPPAGYLPASYVIQGATVPQMGTHWLDPHSPELPPTMAPFTYTMIYGSNNGEVIFIEPMITRSFLLSGTAVSNEFPQPIHFAPSNTYYPSAYSIWTNTSNERIYVSLNDFVWR
jgi:hypothetical protein